MRRLWDLDDVDVGALRLRLWHHQHVLILGSQRDEQNFLVEYIHLCPVISLIIVQWDRGLTDIVIQVEDSRHLLCPDLLMVDEALFDRELNRLVTVIETYPYIKL